MFLQRLIVVLLVALAVASAQLGAALAGPHLAKHGATDHSAAKPDLSDMSGMAEMIDCEKMMGKSDSSDCPCCDPQKSCPPEVCLAKCYKIFGDLPRPPLIACARRAESRSSPARSAAEAIHPATDAASPNLIHQ